MGLISKLLVEKRPAEKIQATSTAEAASSPILAVAPIAPIPPAPSPIHAQPAAPCLLCDCPGLWESIYRDGNFRCPVCDPWPSRNFVGDVWILAELGHGRPGAPITNRWVSSAACGAIPDAADALDASDANKPHSDASKGHLANAGGIPDVDAAWDRFWGHPRLTVTTSQAGAQSYAIAPPGRQGDLILAAAKERERGRVGKI